MHPLVHWAVNEVCNDSLKLCANVPLNIKVNESLMLKTISGSMRHHRLESYPWVLVCNCSTLKSFTCARYGSKVRSLSRWVSWAHWLGDKTNSCQGCRYNADIHMQKHFMRSCTLVRLLTKEPNSVLWIRLCAKICMCSKHQLIDCSDWPSHNFEGFMNNAAWSPRHPETLTAADKDGCNLSLHIKCWRVELCTAAASMRSEVT
jgi:hypothetical protein